MLTNITKPAKFTKPNNSHFLPNPQSFMTTRRGKWIFTNFRILLKSGSSLKIIMGKLK